MRFVYFTHSLVSDWNHGNVHFQRGILSELVARGHEAVAHEPENGWSRTNLVAERGESALAEFARVFPMLESRSYGSEPDVEAMIDGADVVIVHEWTDPALVAAIGARRRRGGGFVLFFHDTHHRAVSAPEEMASLDLDAYDAVLAFGEALSDAYRRLGWGSRVFTWHEGADTRLFRPHPEQEPERDLVWIGNWGDGERSEALRAFLVEPVRQLRLAASAYGVRYPEDAVREIEGAGFAYGGWLSNISVPDAYARHRVTIHVPRGPYRDRLPGIPTIRIFEALACGIPLVSAPWDDAEGLFREGRDYLRARNGPEMTARLHTLTQEPEMAREIAMSGRETILARHTCAHRVDQLFAILEKLDVTEQQDKVVTA